MRLFYCFIIKLCFIFNFATQSIVYDAWKSGVPVSAIIKAKGDVNHAFGHMSLKELTEVDV